MANSGWGVARECLRPCCALRIAWQLKSLQSWVVQAPWRWAGTLLRACSAPKDKDAHLQCQSRAGGCWRPSRGCSVATRGLSSLWVALVPCQQVHTHPVQGCPKPMFPVFLKELIAHRCCKPLSRKFARLFLPRAVWLSGCGLASRRCSCQAVFSGLLSWWCDHLYLFVGTQQVHLFQLFTHWSH